LGIISSGKSAFAATDESVDKMNSDVLEIIENLNISEEQLEFTKNEINNYLEETPLEVDLAFTNYSDHDIVVAHDEKTFIVPGTNVAITYGRQITEHPTTPTLSRETKLYNGTFTKTSYADVHVLYVNIGKIQLNTQVELFPNSLALLSNNASYNIEKLLSFILVISTDLLPSNDLLYVEILFTSSLLSHSTKINRSFNVFKFSSDRHLTMAFIIFSIFLSLIEYPKKMIGCSRKIVIIFAAKYAFLSSKSI